MKKLFMALILTLFLTASVHAAGTVTQSMETYGGDDKVVVTFLCTGDASDGSIPNTTLSADIYTYVKGMYLYEVGAFPTTGGTAPDEANVFVLDTKTGIDLLGSEDGGTTAYGGLKLIHATLGQIAKPNIYLPRAGQHGYNSPIIKSLPILKVTAQGTNSANFTIVMTFVK